MTFKLISGLEQNGFYYYAFQADEPFASNAIVSADVLFTLKNDESYCVCKAVRASDTIVVVEIPAIEADAIVRLVICQDNNTSEEVLSITGKDRKSAMQAYALDVERGLSNLFPTCAMSLFFSPSISIDVAIPDETRTIIRGAVSIADTRASNIRARLLDAQGKTISSRVLIKNKANSYISGCLGADAIDFPFSIDLPNNNSCAYIEIQCDNMPQYNRCFHTAYIGIDKKLKYWDFLNLSANHDPRYDMRIKAHEANNVQKQRQKQVVFAYQPQFSIVVPLFNTPPALFEAMAASVMEQTYSNWELILVNASPENEELAQCVAQAAACDERIKVITLNQNYGITGNTNTGVAQAQGDFVCFFDHDDVLDWSILFEYAQALNTKNDIDLLYCDEDKLFDDGYYGEAFLKPDFSIDMLRNNNYVCHMLCIRKSLLDEIGPTPDGFDGAQDHWLTLRVSEIARRIWHVRKPLYHWRATQNSTALAADSKSYANDAGVRAVQDHLDRLGIAASVSSYGRPFTYRVKYKVEGSPLVSIIIPNKDYTDILSQCLNSIIEKTSYENYEIVIVENNSTEPATFEFYEQIQKRCSKIRVVEWKGSGFNYPAINNYGVKCAQGDYLLFLNNDTEVIDGDWLETMLGFCMREEVGAVGVRLLYPDDTYQHAGLCVSGDGAVRQFCNMPKDALGYFGQNDMTRNVSAVTAACMMSSRSAFEAVEGFSEQFAVAFNDVDYCLKLRSKDYLVVYTADVTLYHHESFSRGDDMHDSSKKERLFYEAGMLKLAWNHIYTFGDPYWNPGFNQFEPEANFARIRPGDEDPYRRSPLVAFMAKVYHFVRGLRR